MAATMVSSVHPCRGTCSNAAWYKRSSTDDDDDDAEAVADDDKHLAYSLVHCRMVALETQKEKKETAKERIKMRGMQEKEANQKQRISQKDHTHDRGGGGIQTERGHTNAATQCFCRGERQETEQERDRLPLWFFVPHNAKTKRTVATTSLSRSEQSGRRTNACSCVRTLSRALALS